MSVARAAARQVAVVTAPKSMPVGVLGQLPGEHGRLEEDDIGHREERGQPGQQFRADRGAIFGKAETGD